MCLITKNAQPMVAKKDIVCYKLLDYNHSPEQQFYTTPFMCTEVELKHINGDEPFVANGAKEVEKNALNDRYYQVGEGFIHTFGESYFRKHHEYIKYIINLFDYVTYSREVYFKCIIPKGSEYFASPDGQELASDKIIFKKKLTKYNFWKERINNIFNYVFD